MMSIKDYKDSVISEYEEKKRVEELTKMQELRTFCVGVGLFILLIMLILLICICKAVCG